MADEVFDAKATIEFEFRKAIQQANDLADTLGRIGESADGEATPGLSRLERQAASVASSLNKLAGVTDDLAKSNNNNLKSILAQEKAYRSYASSIQIVNQTLRDQKKQQDSAFGTYDSNVSATDRRLQVAQATNADLLRIEEQGRQKELASFRSTIVERNRIAEQGSKAQLQYAAAAERAGVAYGQALPVIDRTNQGLISQRYALYDVATTWGAVSAAILGTVAASAKVSIDYQRNFADVIRTTGVVGSEIDELREGLIDLTTEIPSSFEDITNIAALAGQLDVPKVAIEDFTKTVAQFSATTDVSVDSSATALARLAAVTDAYSRDGVSSYNKLASSILLTGINALATESQIVSVAGEIATSADIAGFSAEQTIGLASALASLQVPAERARGTVQRTFSQISSAVSMSGERLDKFASLAKMSADEFADAWENRPQEAFRAFLEGLNEAQQSGQDARNFLRDFGIAANRDTDTLSRLANNLNIVDAAFEDATKGYSESIALQEQFAIIAETLASRLQTLGGTIKGIIATLGGDLGPLGALLDLIQGVAKGFLEVARNPVGRTFLIIATSVGVLVGVMAAYRSIQALTLASMYAMMVAQKSLGISATRSSGALRGLTSNFLTMGFGARTATAYLNAYNASITAGTGRIAAFSKGVRSAAGSMTAFASAGRLVGGTIIGVGLTTLIGYLSSVGNSAQESKQQMEDYRTTLEETTGAVTDLTEAEVARKLEASGVFEDARGIGLSLELVTQAALGNKQAMENLEYAYASVNEEFQRLRVPSASEFSEGSDAAVYYQRLEDELIQYQRILKAVGVETELIADAQKTFNDILTATGGAAEEAGDDLETLEDRLKSILDTNLALINSAVATGNSLARLGESIAQNGVDFSAYSAAGRENLGALQATISAMAQDSTAEELAVKIAGLMQSLSAMGVNVARDLGFLQNMLAELVGGKTPSFSRVGESAKYATDMMNQGFTPAIKKATKASKETKKEIRTLSDYVSDLAGVFKNAFEFRFGLEESNDRVADSYLKIIEYGERAAEAVADAAQAILDANARIQGLNAANNTLEYQLTVAQEYGDTLRATEILAEMAKNNAELADEERKRAKAEKDLQKAQDATNKSLDGTSEASREQRDAVRDLLQAYQEQIIALANTGLSQDELARQVETLRQRFVQQLTQLGYNRVEVDRYAQAFDDLTTIINNVPRNLTLTANANPALRAVEEYIAKLNTAKNTIDGINNTPINILAGNTQGARLSALTAEIALVEATIRNMLNIGNAAGAVRQSDRLAELKQRLATGNYYTGGFTGRGGKYEPKGIVHGGEYVIPKHMVNQRTGLPYANALNQIYQGSSTNNYYNGGHVSNTPAIQVVELLPSQLRQLAGMVSATVSIDGRMIAKAVNNANTAYSQRGSN